MTELRLMSDGMLEMVARRFKLLSEPTRLRILHLLLDGERTVGELIEEMGANQANISHQLNVLADGGLVARRRVDVHIYYRINDPYVQQLSELVCSSLTEQGEADLSLLRNQGFG
jgi:ArsR family transcriptional regulator